MMQAAVAALRYRHATALVVGTHGVLIEGASGSGKSSVAAALLRQADAMGWFVRLVGDDRVGLTIAGDRLVARSHPAVSGLIERRGIGLQRVEHEPACVLHIVVRLLAPAEPLPPRCPEARPVWRLSGITVPMLVLPASLSTEDRAGRLAEAVAGLV